MAAAGPNPQETLIRQTTRTLVEAFQNILQGYPDIGSTVEGFGRYDFLGYTDLNTPINIQNIFGPDFERKAQPGLLFALQELKDDDEIDKTKIHATLLHKYLGIDIENVNINAVSIASPNAVNAYLAHASQEASDYSLHLYFLQPFKLYGITEADRKYEENDSNVSLREWCWSATGCNSAPLFRKILQAFILSEILQDYVENKADFDDPRVAAIQDQLGVLRTQLCTTISADLMTLRDALRHGRLVEGNADGLLLGGRGTRLARDLSRALPNIMDVASLYPLGRLLLGQSSQEAHHLIAQNQRVPFSLSYMGHWLFSHLNFSTSVFWLGVVMTNYRTMWRRLKNYVTRGEPDFSELLAGGVMIIPHAIILVLAPLVMIFPWIYGVTSLPFTLARSLCLYGPFPALKQFWILKCLDVVELIKDAFFFFVYVVPFLPLIFGMINALLPSVLLTVGSMVMFIGLLVIDILVTQHVNADDLQALSILASTHYVSFMGVVISLGFTSFLATGVIARQVALNAPNNMRNILRQSVSLIEQGAEKIAGYFFQSNLEAGVVDMAAVIPEEAAVDAITFSAAPIRVVPQQSNPAQAVLLQRLQNTLNLSPEEKDRLKVQENLEQDYLFTPAEAGQIRALMDVENIVFQTDRQVTRVFGAMPAQNIYIPSQRALSELQTAGQLNTLPEATRNKCNRILALRPAMAPN